MKSDILPASWDIIEINKMIDCYPKAWVEILRATRAVKDYNKCMEGNEGIYFVRDYKTFAQQVLYEETIHAWKEIETYVKKQNIFIKFWVEDTGGDGCIGWAILPYIKRLSL